VTVRTAVRGPMAEIQVEDTGHGIPQDVLPRLFQRPVPHKDGRLGRGLLLVRFLAEQHGGYAKLVWSRPGEGACFAFGIPLAQVATGFSGERLRRRNK
jgi:signal transduction histidine kinase